MRYARYQKHSRQIKHSRTKTFQVPQTFQVQKLYPHKKFQVLKTFQEKTFLQPCHSSILFFLHPALSFKIPTVFPHFLYLPLSEGLFALKERREVFGGGNITFLIEDKGRERGRGRSDKTFGVG